ncbi:anosmin-1 [Nilaparvata lugens]|uniref:anosmin-1 n=1 Tax=Nilaparvata lugens TaxID=108931 RepID=UPI00193E32E0|nr:anosmin-1 [Nilaparvata lugens]
MELGHVLTLCAVFVMNPLPSDSGQTRRLADGDALLLARCDAACKGLGRQCVEKCQKVTKDKPGYCTDDITVLEGACIVECDQDTQCQGTKKCCQHSCGYTCQNATGLDAIPELPPIPYQPFVTELRKKLAQLRWRWKGDDTSMPTVHVVEERSHAGKQFSPSELGEWTVRGRTARVGVRMRHLLPGNWYVFRVAAVSANGSRGYSASSQPFTLSVPPEPPRAPSNVRVDQLVLVNGTLWGQLRWDQPQSDLPIQRYKVYWSTAMTSGPTPTLMVRHRTVPKDKTEFILKKLQPDSQYFLQVEAYSQFGSERLRSDKASLPFNTTNYKTDHWKPGKLKLVLKKAWKWVANKDKELRAQISWKSPKQSSLRPQYMVSWATTSHCVNKTDVQVITQNTYLELTCLQPGCKYKVRVQEMGFGYSRAGSLFITTPHSKD